MQARAREREREREYLKNIKQVFYFAPEDFARFFEPRPEVSRLLKSRSKEQRQQRQRRRHKKKLL